MGKKETFYLFDEQLLWLEKQNFSKLKDWILDLITKGESKPLFISRGYLHPNDIIKNFYNGSQNSDFKTRVEKVIAKIINKWDINRDEEIVLFEASVLAARLKITEARFRMLAFLKEGNLRNREFNGVNLHFHLLRVLAGLKLSLDLKLLINRDFKSPKYAPILFKSTWLIKERGYFHAIELLDQFIDLQREHPGTMEFHSTLRDFLKSFGSPNLEKHFRLILKKLSIKNVQFFIETLDALGYTLHSDNDYNITIYYKIARKKGATLPGNKWNQGTIEIPASHLYKNMEQEDKKALFQIFAKNQIENDMRDIRKMGETPDWLGEIVPGIRTFRKGAEQHVSP